MSDRRSIRMKDHTLSVVAPFLFGTRHPRAWLSLTYPRRATYLSRTPMLPRKRETVLLAFALSISP